MRIDRSESASLKEALFQVFKREDAGIVIPAFIMKKFFISMKYCFL